jgi:putative phosphoesterase
MRYLIASDIHGADECCKKMLEWYEEYGCERMILLGDFLYHGHGGAVPGYDSKAVAEMLNRYASVIYAVNGNCDQDDDQMLFDVSIQADYLLITEGGKAYFCTHGHYYNCGHLPSVMGIDVLLTGHTHVPACENHIDYIYCNPGSVSLPRGMSKKSFMILEGNHLEWHALSDGHIFMQTDL